MGKRILRIAVALVLIAPVDAANAAPKSPKLAKCDGKHRRPANPYGSILPTVDPVSGTSTPASEAPARPNVDVFPQKNPASPKPPAPDGKPQAQVPPIGSWSPPTANRSC